MYELKDCQLKDDIKEAKAFIHESGDSTVALIAAMLHCSKMIASSCSIDNNEITRGYLFDAVNVLDNIAKSLKAIEEDNNG